MFRKRAFGDTEHGVGPVLRQILFKSYNFHCFAHGKRSVVHKGRRILYLPGYVGGVPSGKCVERPKTVTGNETNEHSSRRHFNRARTCGECEINTETCYRPRDRVQ